MQGAVYQIPVQPVRKALNRTHDGVAEALPIQRPGKRVKERERGVERVGERESQGVAEFWGVNQAVQERRQPFPQIGSSLFDFVPRDVIQRDFDFTAEDVAEAAQVQRVPHLFDFPGKVGHLKINGNGFKQILPLCVVFLIDFEDIEFVKSGKLTLQLFRRFRLLIQTFGGFVGRVRVLGLLRNRRPRFLAEFRFLFLFFLQAFGVILLDLFRLYDRFLPGEGRQQFPRAESRFRQQVDKPRQRGRGDIDDGRERRGELVLETAETGNHPGYGFVYVIGILNQILKALFDCASDFIEQEIQGTNAESVAENRHETAFENAVVSL